MDEGRKEKGRDDRVKPKIRLEEIEEFILRLPSVLSARVIVNEWGGIEEVHVLATSERSPKQLVRDVESLMAARWGLQVDHKKISVAQVAAETAGSSFRLVLNNVEIKSDTVHGVMEITVTLLGKDSNEVFEGRATGPYARFQFTRLAAEATVNAVNKAVDPRYVFSVHDAKSVEVGDVEVAVAVLSLMNPRGDDEILAGACPVFHDSTEAIIKAVLQASNRRVNKLYLLRDKTKKGTLIGDLDKFGGEDLDDDD